MSFVLSVAVLSGVYLVVARLERLPTFRFRTLTSPRPYLATDLGWYGVAVAATALSVFVFRPVLVNLNVGPIREAMAGAPFLVKLLLGVVVFDLVSFLVHRALHRYDLLWSIHKVHHSTLQLDGLATTRTHMIENMLRFVPSQALLFLIGMPVTVVATSVAIAAIYGVSNHSNVGINLRCIEPVFVTPRLHRRHHVPSTTQNNYGGIFTIWDRLCGTLVQRDTTTDERFGVPGEVLTYPQAFGPAFRRPLLDIRESNVDHTAAA
ncbi:MAG TPA: sterol desaturase family protein [Acidimicrobiales bacterium]|jgi:sterol desaturase/sphingolipid hydroxylase (fatty acid hydroxylase superfamily)|nr:sterol desaturase family protein [Acidimicrobiales bacterium]